MTAAGRRANTWSRRWGWAVWGVAILAGAVLPPEWLLGAAPRDSWSALATAAHALEFALLAALLVWRLTPQPAPAVPTAGAVALACAAAAAAAVVVELLQRPLPYRSFDVWDLVADAAGIGVGAAIVSVAYRRRVARAPGR